MKNKHFLLSTIHAIACAMVIFFVIAGLTSVQAQIDISKEILVYIQPEILVFPSSEQGFLVPEKLSIRSDALRRAVKQFRVNSVGKAFPDISDADTVKVLEDGRKISVPQFSRIFRFQFGEGNNIDSAIAVLSKIPGILFAEKNMDARLHQDADFHLQWHLNNTGQSGGTPGEDIRALLACAIYTGSSNIRIGIIDSGVELVHDDLTGKSSGDSYTTGSGFPISAQNHGTHVAGIAAAWHGNIGRIRGVDANARVESRRIFQADQVSPSNPWGYVGDADAANKIRSAVDAGSHVINNSWGGSSFSTTLRLAFSYAYKANRVAVASMGNFYLYGNPTNFPAAFGQGIVAVGATDNTGARGSFSQTGAHIDVAAPGVSIYSTLTGNAYEPMSGTSMAAPIVSGIASLLKGYNTNLSNDDIENIIKLSADDKGPSGWDPEYGTGRVNAKKALNFLRPPYTLTQATATGGTDMGASSSYLMTIYGAPGLATGTYIVYRHEVQRNITFSSPNVPHVWGRGVATTGWADNGNVNYSMGWCGVVSGTITSSSATLRTYVYKVYNTLGQLIGWYPAHPDNVVYAYTILSPSDISVSASAAAGWNMSSIPNVNHFFERADVWNNSISNAFSYNPTTDQYVVRNTLENRLSYWIKYPSSQILNYTGAPLDSVHISVSTGWNMIGSYPPLTDNTS